MNLSKTLALYTQLKLKACKFCIIFSCLVHNTGEITPSCGQSHLTETENPFFFKELFFNFKEPGAEAPGSFSPTWRKFINSRPVRSIIKSILNVYRQGMSVLFSIENSFNTDLHISPMFSI